MSRCAGGSAVMSLAVDQHRCRASGVSKPAMTFSSVVLPEPLGPRMVSSSPARDLQRDAVERHDLAEALADPLDPQLGRCHSRSRLLQHPGVPQLLRLGAVLGLPLVV